MLALVACLFLVLFCQLATQCSPLRVSRTSTPGTIISTYGTPQAVFCRPSDNDDNNYNCNLKPSSVQHIAITAAIRSCATAVFSAALSANAATLLSDANTLVVPRFDADMDLSSLITSKAFIDVRIANYTEESVGSNKGGTGSGRVTIGLFGRDAPNAVAYFLACCGSEAALAASSSSSTSSYPSYLGAQFSKISDENVLELDKIRGVNPVVIAGSDGVEYQGKLLGANYRLLQEANPTVTSHYRRGLLTRNRLSNGPQFGITLGPAPTLDQYHEVFGVVVDGLSVLDAIEQIPRYTLETKTGYASKTKGIEGPIADKWFESQRKFYVAAGQMAGDKRAVDQRNKLLKRWYILLLTNFAISQFRN